MAAFCVSCGNPLADGAKFCNKCGATQPAAQAGTVIPPAPAAPASKGSNTAMKIIIGILAFFMFLCCWWRVAVPISLTGSSKRPMSSRNRCTQRQALHRQASALRHVDHQRGFGCLGPDGGVRGAARHHGLRVLATVNGQHFDVEYTWEDGGITMGIAHGAMKHISGMDTFTTVEGIGDEAYLAPGNSALMMRKGDVMVNIDLRESGVSADAAKKMASKIADRL